MEEDVPECCRNKQGRHPPPPPPTDTCVGPTAFSPPYAPRRSPGPATPAPYAQPPLYPACPPGPLPTSPPAYRNYPSPVSGSPTGSPVSPHTQLAPMQFSNMLDEPTESCIIIEEEIERVEPIDFPHNMQNTKKEVKLVRPYGVVIQTIEEVIEELPPGAARPSSVVQRTRRKVTRRGSGAGRSPPTAPPPWDCETAQPWDTCDAFDANAARCSGEY